MVLSIDMSALKREVPQLAIEMERHAEDAAEMLKSLSHSARLLVLCLLTEHERTAGELEQFIGLSQSALSQHLAVLRDRGLVTTRREAQSIYYRVEAGPWVDVLKALHRYYCPSASRSAPVRKIR
jgi:ArsR family transcriptional regulator, virulence genes transcriptional regulator